MKNLPRNHRKHRKYLTEFVAEKEASTTDPIISEPSNSFNRAALAYGDPLIRIDHRQKEILTFAKSFDSIPQGTNLSWNDWISAALRSACKQDKDIAVTSIKPNTYLWILSYFRKS